MRRENALTEKKSQLFIWSKLAFNHLMSLDKSLQARLQFYNHEWNCSASFDLRLTFFLQIKKRSGLWSLGLCAELKQTVTWASPAAAPTFSISCIIAEAERASLKLGLQSLVICVQYLSTEGQVCLKQSSLSEGIPPYQMNVCLFQLCTMSWMPVPAFAAMFNLLVLLLLHCWVLGHCLVLSVSCGGWSESTHYALSRERRGSHETCIHLFSAAGRVCTLVLAIIRLAWERGNSKLSSRGIFGLLVHCSLVSLTPWHSSPGICSVVPWPAFHSLTLKSCHGAKWCTCPVFKDDWRFYSHSDIK